eukprot:CAMPEP_0203961886 /NCGR_PEP_ID=MMETSP0359-20131031/92226_1 /ASSEMBLY_ACC=CAM_ASM_000338 /TAXON_ID=268821 /ORGANISM="Scrippsiella Hangoei, Strain SHTV-5" /LENGTH=49 /DNA_ID=CAMNT_0050896953 /DNA_START=14 /DNA_END=163 /DNA_ORIENTATION=+
MPLMILDMEPSQRSRTETLETASLQRQHAVASDIQRHKATGASTTTGAA